MAIESTLQGVRSRYVADVSRIRRAINRAGGGDVEALRAGIARTEAGIVKGREALAIVQTRLDNARARQSAAEIALDAAGGGVDVSALQAAVTSARASVQRNVVAVEKATTRLQNSENRLATRQAALAAAGSDVNSGAVTDALNRVLAVVESNQVAFEAVMQEVGVPLEAVEVDVPEASVDETDVVVTAANGEQITF